MPIEVDGSWDNQRLKRDRLVRLQGEMRARGVGALYLYDGINVRYVLNTYVPGGAAFVPAEGEAIGLIRPRDIGYVKLQHPNVMQTFYTSAETWGRPDAEERLNEFAHGVKDLMIEHGAGDAPLAIDQLDVAGYHALEGVGIKLATVAPIIEMARSVKTDDEVEIYRGIGEQYTHAIRAFRDAIRPGISEIELSAVVTNAWQEAGGEDIAQLNVCSGPRMNPWRRWPTERKLQEGEFVGIDLHGRGICGLRGDASRTFFVGDQPTQEQRDLYRRAYDYMMETADQVRAGLSLREYRERVPQVPEQFRVQLENYNIIHGVGLQYSGYPQVERRKDPPDDILRPNQVLSVESFFAEEGSPLAVKLEENIVVQDGPPLFLGPNIPFDERFIRQPR